MPCVEVSETISGVCAAEAYGVIKDMERYPLFMPDLASVKVLRKGEGFTITKWKSKVNGMVFSWVEKDSFDDVKMCIAYEQVEGDLKKFAGRWNVSPAGGGVCVSLRVEFELGVPMLAGMIDPLLKKTIRENCVKMIKGIEKELNRSIDCKR